LIQVSRPIGWHSPCFEKTASPTDRNWQKMNRKQAKAKREISKAKKAKESLTTLSMKLQE
jgi:hypothetical protein